MEIVKYKRQFILLILFISFAHSQILKGRVFDNETKAALANCNISIVGTNRGAIANNNGYYSLELSNGNYTILFQYIGYKSDTIKIDLRSQTIVRNIALKKQILAADDILIIANLYSKAEQLILRASQEKKEYLKRLQNYSCKSYTKSTVFRKSNPQSIKYGLLMEFYSKVFWNAPDYYYEVIESQKQSANIPQSISIFSGNAFLNINADRFSLGEKSIVGPTAPDAIEYYDYEIIDTLFQDRERIFKMRIEPKENTRPLMSGVLYLVDKKFVIQKINVRMNALCNYGFFQNMHIIQQYAMVPNTMYLPYYSLKEGDWIINIPKYPKLKFKNENFREDYSVNTPLNRKYYGIRKIVFENRIPFSSIPMNIPPLTVSEDKGYWQIDSIITHRPIVHLMTKAIKIIDYYSCLKKQPVGSFSDFYRFNKAEGNFFGLAINTKNLFKPLNFYGAMGKGLSDKRYKYDVQLGSDFNQSPFKGSFVLREFDTIARREGQTELPVWFNTFSSLLGSLDYFDYFYTKGRSLSLNINMLPFRLGTTLFAERHQNTKNYYTRGLMGDSQFVPALTINEGAYRGFRFFLNYSTASYRQTPLSKEIIQNQPYTEIFYSYENALTKWGSVCGYFRQQLILYFRKNTFFNGLLDFKIDIASGSAHLPVQKYFELESGFSGYERFKTFRTQFLNAYTGNKKIAFYAEHNFHNSFFRWSHLPYIENMPLDLIFIYNGGWAGADKWDSVIFNKIYSETGFGIGRLFSLLKLEFLWRLKNNHSSKNFVFSVKMTEIEL